MLVMGFHNTKVSSSSRFKEQPTITVFDSVSMASFLLHRSQVAYRHGSPSSYLTLLCPLCVTRHSSSKQAALAAPCCLNSSNECCCYTWKHLRNEIVSENC